MLRRILRRCGGLLVLGVLLIVAFLAGGMVIGGGRQYRDPDRQSQCERPGKGRAGRRGIASRTESEAVDRTGGKRGGASLTEIKAVDRTGAAGSTKAGRRADLDRARTSVSYYLWRIYEALFTGMPRRVLLGNSEAEEGID